jgi:hypothetical protein
MVTIDSPQTWGYLNAGPRPSTLLAGGAVVAALGPIALALQFATFAWVCWAIGLLLTGVGLLLSGLRPWLTSFAVVPAGMFLAQGASLLLTASGLAAAAAGYFALTLPKWLSLFVLAIVAARQVDRRRRRWLAVVVVLSSLKYLTRHLAQPPATVLAVLDILLAVLLASALVQWAVVLRRLETAWAAHRWRDTHARFEDFNPPPLQPLS